MDALPFCRATLHGVRCRIGPYFTIVKGYPAEPQSIGEAIRKRRLDLGLRQVDVAKLISCDQMTVVNWEKGYTTPRSNKIAQVERFLAYPKEVPWIGDAIRKRRLALELRQKETRHIVRLNS